MGAGWLWPVAVWVLGLLVAAGLAYVWRGGGPPAWRLAGFLLELLGLLLGAWVLAATWIEATGARTPAEWARDVGRGARRVLRRAGRAVQRRWLRLLVRLGWAEPEPEHQTVSAGVAEAVVEARPVGISQTDPPERDLEERVERLEEQVKQLHGKVADVRKEVSRREKWLEGELASVSDDLRKADRRLREDLEGQITEAAVGTVGWEYVALGWFVVGVLATAWAGVLSPPSVPM